jgi:hypothetical protein
MATKKVTKNRKGDELTTDAKGNKLTYKVGSSGAIYDYRTKKYVHESTKAPGAKTKGTQVAGGKRAEATSMPRKPTPALRRKPTPRKKG